MEPVCGIADGKLALLLHLPQRGTHNERGDWRMGMHEIIPFALHNIAHLRSSLYNIPRIERIARPGYLPGLIEFRRTLLPLFSRTRHRIYLPASGSKMARKREEKTPDGSGHRRCYQ
jgi:hypothetical protein